MDAAGDAPGARQAAAVVIEAVRRRLVTVEGVRHAWSVPELELIELVVTSTALPEGWPNAELRSPDGLALPTPDLWFDDVGLALQRHSRAYHLRDADWEATVAGDTALGEHTIVVLGITPLMVARKPQDGLARIERAYRNARHRPRPNVLATPRYP